MNGWIHIHRKIKNWEWYSEGNTFRVFFHCLINANWRDRQWQGIHIPTGSLFTSILEIADQLNLSRQNVRTSIKRLKSTGEITTTPTNKGILITVCKYADYNEFESKANQQNNQRANHHLTSSQPSTNHQLTTPEEEEEYKEEKEDVGAAPILTTQDLNDSGEIPILESEQLAAVGNYREALSKRIDLPIRNIEGIATTKGIPVEVFDAWLVDRAASDWRRPDKSPVVASTWLADLEAYNRRWQKNEERTPANQSRGKRETWMIQRELDSARVDYQRLLEIHRPETWGDMSKEGKKLTGAAKSRVKRLENELAEAEKSQ